MSASVGVADHAGWAILVTVAGGRCIDRRRVELVEPGVPVMPYHHDALRLPIAEGVKLVERVAASAASCSARVLAELEISVGPIAGISLRERPTLPPTIAERLASVHAQNRADWVMYRDALATAATARGWRVHWYATAIEDDAKLARLVAAGEPLGRRGRRITASRWPRR